MVVVGMLDEGLLRTILIIFFAVLCITYWGWHCRCAANMTFRIAHYLVFLGLCANVTVCLANGGYMPVRSKIYYDGSIWIPMTGSTVYNWLGDRFFSIGCSIGDLLLLAALILALGTILFRKLKKDSEVEL